MDPVLAWQETAAQLADEPSFEKHWNAFQAAYGDWDHAQGPPPAWVPDADRAEHANLNELMVLAGASSYEELHAWSAANRGTFWGWVAKKFGYKYPGEPLLGDEKDPIWFDGAQWNATAMCFRAPGDRIAIVSGDEAGGRSIMTYAELQTAVNQFSNGLLGAGLVAGDAVALYMPMDRNCVIAYLAAIQAGLAIVSIPDSFAPDEVATRLRLGDAKMLITVDAYTRGGKQVAMLAKAQEAAAQQAGCRLVVCGEAPADTIPWNSLLSDHLEFEPVAVPVQSVSNILFSSGTTGEPKAIGWTHLTPLKAAMDGRFHQDIHAGDVVAWPTNIGWMMGPWLVYASLANGATMALFEGAPNTQAFVEFMSTSQVTMLGVVPAIVRAWREQGVAPGALASVQTFSSTGEASNAHDMLYLMSLADYRAPVIEYCGGTEIGGGHLTGTVMQPQSPATFSTPSLGLDFVVLREDAPVDVGDMGELYLIPPSIGLSQKLLNRNHHAIYYEDCPPGPNGEILRRHGDQVQRLAAGYWRAQGRADDTMNLGGIKVGSVELETVLNETPGVRETAAVAVAPVGGGADRLVVFAVLEPGIDIASIRAPMQQAIKARLNPLFRIHDVVEREALPRTASNKVMRRVLRDEYAPSQSA